MEACNVDKGDDGDDSDGSSEEDTNDVIQTDPSISNGPQIEAISESSLNTTNSNQTNVMKGKKKKL